MLLTYYCATYILKDITEKSSSEEVTGKGLIKAKQFNVVCRDGVITSIT